MQDSHAISRRDMLTGGLSALAAVPMAAAKGFQMPHAAPAITPITTSSVAVGGLLLATSTPGLPAYVLQSDRATGFIPIYLEGSLPLAGLVGQHVTARGHLSNVLTGRSCAPPALVMTPMSVDPSTAQTPPIPHCDQTLEEVPLTYDEAATAEQVLTAYITATSANPDTISQSMIQDQAIQALNSRTFAAAAADTPFVFVEEDLPGDCVQCYNMEQFFEYLNAAGAAYKGPMPTLPDIGEPAIAAGCALAILRLVLGVLIGLIVTFMPKRTLDAIETQARLLITNPAVLKAVTTIFKALQDLIAGTLTGKDVGPIVVAGIQAMAAPLGAALLALCKTLSWTQYVLAALKAAGIWVQVAIWVARIAGVIANLVAIVKACAALEPPPLPEPGLLEAPAAYA